MVEGSAGYPVFVHSQLVCCNFSLCLTSLSERLLLLLMLVIKLNAFRQRTHINKLWK